MSFNITSTLLGDYYKQCHADQYPSNLTKLESYGTIRWSYLEKYMSDVVIFGLQYFVKAYLIDHFNENFFNVPLQEVLQEHGELIKTCMTSEYYSTDRIEKLHKLGYLPIELYGIEEGTVVKVGVPTIRMRNTHKDFPWVGQFIESILSANYWYPMVAASQAKVYRDIVNKYFDESVEDDVPRHSAISEFGFRGSKMTEAGMMASAAFLTSFTKSATVPATPFLEYYYKADRHSEPVGTGMISTEHSVMALGAAVYGSEKAHVEILLDKQYPNGNISMVCDTYDHFNMVDKIIGQDLKELVQNRKGCLFLRGDSGNQADIICGTLNSIVRHVKQVDLQTAAYEAAQLWATNKSESAPELFYMTDCNGVTAKVNVYPEWVENDSAEGGYYSGDIESIGYDIVKLTPEEMGTVWCLYNRFGGAFNTKGYIVLNSCVKALYGDGITPELAEKIYKRLLKMSFAANNIALGAGSFSLQCARVYERGMPTLKPFTRDTFGFAIKATYAELEQEDGTIIPFEIFKNPKTDVGVSKKSQRGMVLLYQDENGDINWKDGYNSENFPIDDDIMVLVFKDGKQYNEVSLNNIRKKLWKGKF